MVPGLGQNGPIRFRSHIGRGVDLTLLSNRTIVALTAVALIAGLVLVFANDASVWLPVIAAGTTYLVWALARELDPDRNLTAVVAAVLSTVWVLAGYDVALLALGGMILVGRLLVETTGRRPLLTDLAVVAVVATVIAFTPAGWVTGFGLAVAIFVDDRMATEHNSRTIVVAVVAALGASVVATLADAIPQGIPEVRPGLAIPLGLLALITVAREPPQPTSQVDSRRKTFLKPGRLHAARIAIALILFGAALVSGDDGTALIPATIALALSLASSEAERVRRTRYR